MLSLAEGEGVGKFKYCACCSKEFFDSARPEPIEGFERFPRPFTSACPPKLDAKGGVVSQGLAVLLWLNVAYLSAIAFGDGWM
jgi:hypothetical protein